MFVYEASRPDATELSHGLHATRACSKPNVLPWTSVSFATALGACESAGYRLCNADEWLRACEGTAASEYPYGASYAAERCNGADHDADRSEDGLQNAVLPTASLPTCISENGIFDLSGNAKEWTDDLAGVAAGQALYVVRGGSHQSPEHALQCQALQSQATATTVLPSLGFRCCIDEAP
jgi:formylglycine-generating enzyme required for sulfatase activity